MKRLFDLGNYVCSDDATSEMCLIGEVSCFASHLSTFHTDINMVSTRINLMKTTSIFN